MTAGVQKQTPHERRKGESVRKLYVEFLFVFLTKLGDQGSERVRRLR